MKEITNIFSIDPNAKEISCRKGELLQRVGSLKAPTFYVKKGLLRSYIIDSKGKEHIFMFAPENWIIADVEALEYNQPIKLFIDCLEDSELILFDRDCLFKETIAKDELRNSLQLLFRRLGKLQRRVLMLMSTPAIDRYLYFIETYPELQNRIPQRMIATYLGITPQALSTIRSKIARTR